MVAARAEVQGRRRAARLHPHGAGRRRAPFESFDAGGETKVFETGRVLVWEPPTRLVFEWRAAVSSPSERTEVDVEFAPSGNGTLVTVTHRGWNAIRPDHPARHGMDVAPFLRMMGLWWGDLLTALREHTTAEHARS